MRKLFLILSLAAMAASVFAADFRNVNWGMSMEGVLKKETAELKTRNKDLLLFTTVVGGLEMHVRYLFKDNQLNKARYEFTGKYRDPKDYNRAYEDITRQLTRKYGEALNTQLNCRDSFYKDFPRRWGTGIVVGKLRRATSWQTDKAYVHHTIGAYPGGLVAHWVEYSPLIESTLDKYSEEFATAL